MPPAGSGPPSSGKVPTGLPSFGRLPDTGPRHLVLTLVQAARIPTLLALVTLAIFSPALWHGFVDWDDQVNFLTNYQFRGLSWTHLRWMFTTVLMGQWIPLTWMTLGFDYLVWGMKPAGYHLTNLLLHAAGSAVFYLIARRLLRATMPRLGDRTLTFGAIGAALFFAIHPLRAESVAWVTERRDVLSGLFFFLTVLTYLKSTAEGTLRPQRWRMASIGFYALAVLSKSMVATLPFVLLLLDVYPFRRVDLRQWKLSVRSLIAEKVPYVALGFIAAFMAVYAQRTNKYLTSLDTLPALSRIPVTLYSVWFYVSTTVMPLGLSPLYELPARVDPWHPRFVVSALGSIAVTVALVVLRRRWPAGLAAWVAYLIILAPVSGILHNGHQIAHDRYSYLSCLPWALIFGGALCAAIQAGASGAIRASISRLTVAVGGVWLLALASMTWHQASIWRDNDTLWRYALDIDPLCSICHSNLGVSLYSRRILDLAIARYQYAIALRPDRVRTHGNLALALMAAGRQREALPHFEALLAQLPRHSETRVNMAVALIQLNRLDEAIGHLRTVIGQEPNNALALTNLGSALLDTGHPEEAVEHLRRAAELKPDITQPRVGLVRTYLALGKTQSAREQLEVLKVLDPATAEQMSLAFASVW